MRLTRIAYIAALLVCGWSASATAEDAEHWRTPSRPFVDDRTLFDAGIPRRDEQPASTAPAAPAEGAVLYAVHCSSCHGTLLQGSAGVPPLTHDGGAAVDFYLTTGRMPLAVTFAPSASGRTTASMTQDYHVLSHFDDRQTAAIEAFVNAHATQTIPIPRVRINSSLLQRGRLLFEDNCQACHGAAAEGATVGYQWTALPLDKANPTQIGEAVRTGPGVMPKFTPAVLSDEDLDAVATYVRYLATTRQTYGGTVMDYLGPTAEGAVGVFIGVGSLFWVVYFTGTKADGRRAHEIDYVR